MKHVVLRNYASGVPNAEDFAVETVPIPTLGAGQILLKSHWLSLDPLIRFAIDEKRLTGVAQVNPGDVLYGGAISQVEASNVEDFAVGDWVEGRTGWTEYAAIDPNAVKLRKIDPALAPVSTALGLLGMPGQTAHAAVIQIGRVKAGETVCISAAAGAVGTIAGQIAKAFGARVVGIAGGPEKCRAVEAIGFDACVDYKVPDFKEQLAAALPDKIDCYIENVGGEVMLAVMPHLKYGARMPVCGFIAYYGVGMEGPGPDHLPGFMRLIMSKGLELRGFGGSLLGTEETMSDLARWYGEGKIRPIEAVHEGLESAPAAFAGIFSGNSNVGKTIVKLV